MRLSIHELDIFDYFKIAARIITVKLKEGDGEGLRLPRN